jgi:chromate reductase, NAD(P)H dehydrogenase (quinone)
VTFDTSMIPNFPPPAEEPLHFLAISGSLRAASSNTILLRAAAALAPRRVRITLYDGLGDLPHFNPDLDTETAPSAVAELRSRLRAADAVLICSPEYAHGVPGALKNALDWIVGSGELMDKPVALLNASLVSTHAQNSLHETLSVMMARVMLFRVPLASNKIEEASIVTNSELSQALQKVVSTLADAVTEGTS